MEDDILFKEDGVPVCPREIYRDGGVGGEESPSTEIIGGVDDRAGRHVVMLERRCLPGRMVAL